MKSLILALLFGCTSSVIFLWCYVKLLASEIKDLREELIRLQCRASKELPKEPTYYSADNGGNNPSNT